MMPPSPRSTGFLERLPLLGSRRWLAYAITLAVTGVAAMLRFELDHVFPPGFPYLTFFPAVIVCSFLFGRGPGITAAAAGGLTAWYYFIPPFHSFSLGPATGLALAFYIGVVAVDIALVDAMQRANGRLREERSRSRNLAARAELLFSELQHRVANNLQMVGAVLSLQKRGIADMQASKALDDASMKLQLIGRIQRQLYDAQGSRVSPKTYLNDLAADLLAAGGKPGITCAVDIDGRAAINPDDLIPLALIMAEAMANAIEHGFADRSTGAIAIILEQCGERLHLEVLDDGRGLPSGFNASVPASLGLKIAFTLAGQLAGSIAMTEGPRGGTRFALDFPADLTAE